jgi:hypothetical protein
MPHRRLDLRIIAILTPLVLLASAAPAAAVEVYFNGVRVSGLKNQQFKGCSVRFDADGNVHITAKGYTVKRMGDGAEQNEAPTPKAKHYFLYSKATRPGYAQYDVDVYINGKWVKKVRNNQDQVIAEITKHLKPGKNVISFAATKNYSGGERKSESPKDYVQVSIGAGTAGGGTVNITSNLVTFKAPASRTENFGQEKTISIR